MSIVIECSYGEKYEFYQYVRLSYFWHELKCFFIFHRKEHEMFEKKLEEFQEWMIGPNNLFSLTSDIEHEVFCKGILFYIYM